MYIYIHIDIHTYKYTYIYMYGIMTCGWDLASCESSLLTDLRTY